MAEYTKLIKALRCCAEEADCINCPRKGGDCVYGPDGLLTDAAAAIEALQTELDKYHELCDVDEIPEVLEILMTV